MGGANRSGVNRSSATRSGTTQSGPNLATTCGIEGFAVAARVIGEAARGAGLTVPAFRAPPRVPGAMRTLRRLPGGAVVSVQLRDRPFEAVVADMVEGVVVANRLVGEPALRVRTSIAHAVAGLGGAGTIPSSAVPSEEARVVERQTRAA